MAIAAFVSLAHFIGKHFPLRENAHQSRRMYQLMNEIAVARETEGIPLRDIDTCTGQIGHCTYAGETS